MCFDDDADWEASVCEDETKLAEKLTKCNECCRMIPVGNFVRHIFMQEHEYCKHDPENDDCEDVDDEGEPIPHPADCEHDYGETFDWDCCETCNQLIEAIHQHELEEGCHDSESRPGLGGLYDAIHDGDGTAYLAKAEALYPGIMGRLPECFQLD